jgi:hypothetical protein
MQRIDIHDVNLNPVRDEAVAVVFQLCEIVECRAIDAADSGK